MSQHLFSGDLDSHRSSSTCCCGRAHAGDNARGGHTGGDPVAAADAVTVESDSTTEGGVGVGIVSSFSRRGRGEVTATTTTTGFEVATSRETTAVVTTTTGAVSLHQYPHQYQQQQQQHLQVQVKVQQKEANSMLEEVSVTSADGNSTVRPVAGSNNEGRTMMVVDVGCSALSEGKTRREWEACPQGSGVGGQTWLGCAREPATVRPHETGMPPLGGLSVSTVGQGQCQQQAVKREEIGVLSQADTIDRLARSLEQVIVFLCLF